MNPAEDDRWRAIEEAVSDLARRQSELERRLARLEPAPPAEPARPLQPPVVPRQAPRAAPHSALETRVGLTWINRVGVVTLVLGVAFFFKYAVDNQWIGEAARVVLGVAAGLAALALGDLLWRSGQRPYGQGICGAGIAILYVSFYVSAGFYHVLNVTAAFLLMTAVTAATGILSVRYGSAAIAVLGLIGGYQTPLVLDARAAALWFFLGYVLLLDVGALALARSQKWRSLEALAFAATLVLFLSRTGFPPDPEHRVVLTTFNLLYAAVFIGVLGRTVPALAQAAGIAWAWGIWSGGAGATWQQAAFTLLATVLAAGHIACNPALRRSRAWVVGTLATFLAMAAPVVFAGCRMTMAWCAIAAVLAWAARETRSAKLFDAAGVASLFIILRLYGSDLSAARAPRFAAFILAALVFWAAARWTGHNLRALALYVAGHVHMLSILGLEILDWNRRTTLRENLPSVNSASIAVLMGLYALVLVAAGVASRSALNRMLGLALTGLVVLKLYLYDVWQLSRIYRFSAFALLGLVLLVTSYLYSRFRAPKTER